MVSEGRRKADVACVGHVNCAEHAFEKLDAGIGPVADVPSNRTRSCHFHRLENKLRLLTVVDKTNVRQFDLSNVNFIRRT